MSEVKRTLTPKTIGKKLFSDYSYLVSFVLIVVIAAIVNPNFFGWRNITNIFVQSSVTGIIALG
ncbi:MAG: ABC transporter permease, partial [Clostridia bacterium]